MTKLTCHTFPSGKVQKIPDRTGTLAQKRNLILKNECADTYIMSGRSFERITSSLVSNAIKFAPPGTPNSPDKPGDDDKQEIGVIDQGQRFKQVR
ncbi:MAG: hypothetical protein IPM93_25060 [Candidatus Obscuribacter sp.]|nr:hypothetical protein [Candidatus Obscuribacter sp.]